MSPIRRVIRRTPRSLPEERDLYDHLLRSLEEMVRIRLAESITAREIRGGYVDLDDERPGYFTLHLQTVSGYEQYVGATKSTDADTQSGSIGEQKVTSRHPAPSHEIASREPTDAMRWSMARDATARPEDRLVAIRNLPRTSDDVPRFVAIELLRHDLPEDWRNLLVFFAEDLHFPVDLRRAVGERLLTIASSLRDSAKVGADKVAWAAMRRAATLTPREPARFLPFLDRRGAVDTRAVALRCIQRAFEAAPPDDANVEKPVADRVAEFAIKFLDPDVFAGGENALIAQNAIYALAALDDDRLETAVAAALRLNRRWLKRQLRSGLIELLRAWEVSAGGGPHHQAAERVSRQIDTLS